MSLTTYKKKRKFDKTPEPIAVAKHRLRAVKWRKEKTHKQKTLRFVVQEHHASHLHWDFRLELDGVLKSWAVPKGPTMDPSIKHLAVHVEDHPFSYRKFAGTIPEGNYGAGKVTIWDEGTYTPIEESKDPEKMLRAGLKKGDLKFILFGKKLTGEFALVKFGGEEKNWLLIKKRDISISVIPDAGREDPENKKLDSRLRGNDKRKKSPFPHTIKPMLAKLADAPFDNPAFLFEIKWDGYRAIAEIKKGKVRLYSRNNQDFTKIYQSVVKAISAIHHDVILDGEVVALDKEGKSQFQLLQEYRKNHEIPLVYYVFDLLYLDGYDLRQIPLTERKSLLKKLLPTSTHLKYSDHVDTHGIKAFTFAKKKNFEGIIAKKKDSTYVSLRSSEWLKIKHIQMQEAVICGFTKPRGMRKEFGALILGLAENGEYRYIGHTGGGFDEKQLQSLITLLKPLVTTHSPFSVTPKTNMPATWVKPKIVAQVKFSEWTRDGVMRQPIFLGLREDKKPEDVKQEQIIRVQSKKDDEPTLPIKTKAQLSNLDKIFWPQEGYTKGDVLAYYDRIAPYILPYLKDRPESLNRHPDGIDGISFYQKDITSAPDWVKLVPIYSESDKKNLHWLVCNDKDSLLYLANLGCIELNPWSSRVNKKEHPDYLIIDLDPNGVEFKEVVTTAQTVKKLLDEAKIESFVKTSGKTGLHILIPLGARYTFTQTKQFAEVLANMASQRLPHTTSVVRSPEKREKKVYIDFLQNRFGQTITAPYSLRPVPNAPVSTPLDWDEVTTKLSPTDFTIKNIFKRLEKKGDIWKKLLHHKGIDMLKSLELLHKNKPTA